MKKEADREAIAAKLAAIENEMKQAGFWQQAPLADELYDFRAAFAMDTMTFMQWLQFIFIPRVKDILTSGGDFPAASHVGQQAFKEFVMYPAYDEDRTKNLLAMLNEFDALF